jgi:hypothetical protein
MEKLWQPDCRSWKEMLATLPIEPLKLPAFGLCFIAEEKENLNSDWGAQINHG